MTTILSPIKRPFKVGDKVRCVYDGVTTVAELTKHKFYPVVCNFYGLKSSYTNDGKILIISGKQCLHHYSTIIDKIIFWWYYYKCY